MENKADLSQHHVDTLVVSCVDFRFRPLVAEWIGEKFGSADHVAVPGASKPVIESSDVLDWLKLLVGLHEVKKVVIADHLDCGAYGGSKKFDGDSDAEVSMHAQQLSTAKQKLVEALPGVEVETFLLGPEGEVSF